MTAAWLKLMRLYYGLPLAGGLIVIVSYLRAGDIEPIRGKVVTAFISLFMIISAGYVLNDVYDREIDKINRPGRQVVGKIISPKTATRGAMMLFAGGLILGFFGGYRFWGVLVPVVILLILYDIYSKRMGIFKDVLVAVLTTSLYPLAFALTSAVSSPRLPVLYIHPIWLFFTTLGYEMLKDVRDAAGDRRVEGCFLPSYSVHKWFEGLAKMLVLSASLITLLPILLGYCKEVYMWAAIGAIILAAFSLLPKPARAIRFIYAEVFLITAGSMVDLMVYGP